ncbi:FAD-dependent monooxygenase [Saccharopolyspora dendranthemae]|uniref:2-polyprenyl-6-methoxyphenol hydroxylase-like FAD-dependent oxidoreductase n=1 Tax=Saccharopolyspora dendranthemae TaxID=1181886 RepID=A0A561U2K5_9PSEU|nr:FAD-dependent monooxygenase [Saccharopolyspora dendranthemae]TWF93576.1 2-polyprenyl-6-methoxyphenol hydroxylase-like FAD-dependent oxidoreductase [Saccharopolyspora dendranthemae]
MAEQDERTAVLVVGGSLVGLSAAVFLSRRGVPTVVVEKHRGSSPHPRAIGYTTRTVELYRAAGVELPASAFSGPPRRARVFSLAGEWFEESPWTPGEAAPQQELSPVSGTAIAQDGLEPILRERAGDLGADLRSGVELVELAQEEDGVLATLRERDGGREYRVRAEYVIAADGAGSGVRERLGIGRSGQGLLSVQRSILFRAPIDRFLERGVSQFQIDQPDFTPFLTTYSDGRWVLMLSDDVDLDEDEQREAVCRAVGIPDLEVELITTGRWELAALIADRFADERIFLAGDAAHQLPPNRGGFGANTGIEDVHNLAWKLAEVLDGRADPALLETYDAERRPIAWLRHQQIFARADFKAHLETEDRATEILDDAAVELGQLYRSAAVIGADDALPPAKRPDEWVGQPGTRAPHLRINGDDASTLDLFQRGWVLLSADDSWAEEVEHASESTGAPIEFVRIDVGGFPAAYGVGAVGASLIRPDGYVAWRTTAEPEGQCGALAAALTAVTVPAKV